MPNQIAALQSNAAGRAITRSGKSLLVIRARD
jgi:hypothetical protein